MITLTLNGETRQIEAATLAEALERTGFGSAKVATALNGAFIPASLRETTPLKDGDALEVLAPMQGG